MATIAKETTVVEKPELGEGAGIVVGAGDVIPEDIGYTENTPNTTDADQAGKSAPVAAVPAPAEKPTPDVNYADMTVAELDAYAEANKVDEYPKSGNKADKVTFLQRL